MTTRVVIIHLGGPPRCKHCGEQLTELEQRLYDGRDEHPRCAGAAMTREAMRRVFRGLEEVTK